MGPTVVSSAIFLYIFLCSIVYSNAFSESDTSCPCRNSSLALSYQPDNVMSVWTQDVKLRCEKQPSIESSGEKLLWLQITKKMADVWVRVADIRDVEGTVVKDSNISSEGHLDTRSGQAFLELNWDFATSETFGSYRCEAFGVSQSNEFFVEKSETIKLTEKITSQALVSFWYDFRQYYNKLESCTSKTSKPDLLELKIDEFGPTLEKHLRDLSYSPDDYTQILLSYMWQRGGIALLKPENGCPYGFSSGYRSNLKFHEAQSSVCTSQDFTQTNLSTPVRDTRIVPLACTVYLRFCESANAPVQGIPWPRGNYCVNKMRISDCPTEFQTGQVRLYANKNANWETYNVQSTTAWDDDGFAVIGFCCANTGSSKEAMLLPTLEPFYLYRYGGQCQEVRGMNVSSQYLDILTEEEGRYDTLTGGHPDITIRLGQPTRIHLCFYSRNV